MLNSTISIKPLEPYVGMAVSSLVAVMTFELHHGCKNRIAYRVGGGTPFIPIKVAQSCMKPVYPAEYKVTPISRNNFLNLLHSHFLLPLT